MEIMVNNNLNTYIVTSNTKRFNVLDGYSCKAQSKDHFLRHLGHKFFFVMNSINNAYSCGDIRVDIYENNVILNSVNIINKKPNVVDEYYGLYSYILVLNKGTNVNPIIEIKEFVNYEEAHEWIKQIN